MGNTLLVSRAGNYASEKSDTRAYYGFDVLFDRPVILEANKDREGGGHLLAPFFFFFCGLLSQTGRSIPNEAGIGPEIFKY